MTDLSWNAEAPREAFAAVVLAAEQAAQGHVAVNSNVPAYTGLVIDKAAVVSAVGEVFVSTTLDRYFETDDVGLKATWRIGQNIVRPDRVGVFTVDDGGS